MAGDRINTSLQHVGGHQAHIGWQPIPGLTPELLPDLLLQLAAVRGDGMSQIGRKESVASFFNDEVNLVLIGGGSNIHKVSTTLGRPLQSKHERGGTRARFRSMTLQPTLLAPGSTALHTLALGLSYHPGEHPGFLDRHEIEDWQPPVSSRPEFNDHNLIDD